MHFQTKKCLFLAYFWYNCGGEEREDYEAMLNKRFSRDQEWLRKNGLMEPESLKLTTRGRDYVNGCVNLFDNNPVDNARYWNKRVAVGVEKGFIAEEKVTELKADFTMGLEEAVSARLQKLSSSPITPSKRVKIAIGETVKTQLQDGVDESEEPANPQEENVTEEVPNEEETPIGETEVTN